MVESSCDEFDYSLVDRAVQTIVDKMNPNMIFIFGSVATHTARYDSDIDIIVVMDTDVPYLCRNIPIHNAFRESGLRVDRDIIVLTPEEFRNKLQDKSSFVHEVYTKGYVAYEA